MSAQYDLYLQKHKANVHKSFEWIRENLPELLLNLNTENIEWQIEFAHDASKSDPDEYEAYDAYFYGGNKSFKVVQNFNKAWLLHIHRNPHHWQHWILIHDDPNEPETILDMPYNYILEMICDWWSFSWRKKNLFEIFNWYDEHKDYIKLSDKTRKTVEDILNRIKEKLSANVSSEELMHHGIKGQKWGVRRYQNLDGTLTALGKKRKGSVEEANEHFDKMIKRNGGIKDGYQEIKNPIGTIRNIMSKNNVKPVELSDIAKKTYSQFKKNNSSAVDKAKRFLEQILEVPEEFKIQNIWDEVPTDLKKRSNSNI